MSDNNSNKFPYEYTFWFTFFKKTKDKQLEEFEDNLKKIGDFSTPEQFWGIYEHMKRPDSLPRGCEYFLFRKGIRPLWEDPSNIGGGRFYINMKKNPITNKIWEDLQIAFLLTKEDFFKICGIVMNVRTSEIILSIWTKSLNDIEKVKIRNWINTILEISNEQFIEYKKHPNTEQLIKKQEDLVKEEEDRKEKLIEQKLKEQAKIQKLLEDERLKDEKEEEEERLKKEAEAKKNEVVVEEEKKEVGDEKKEVVGEEKKKVVEEVGDNEESDQDF